MVAISAGKLLVLIAFAIEQASCNSPTSVTVKGQAGGSYTFETIFTPKLCSALTKDDLSHLSSFEFSEAKGGITAVFGETSKCIVVFGVLVIANIPDHGNYVNDNWISLFANTLAVIMDKDRDGVVDDPAIGDLMKSRPGTTAAAEDGGVFIFGRANFTTDRVENAMLTLIGRTTSIKQDEDFGPHSEVGGSMRRMTEEIFHTYQHKLGVAHPTVWGAASTGCPNHGHYLEGGVHFLEGARFGESSGNHSVTFAWQFSKRDDCSSPNPDAQQGCDYTQSTLMKCAYRAQCSWYTSQICCSNTGHSASGADVTGGGCIWPSCAGIEWYYNLIFEYTETMYPGSPHLQGAGEWDMGRYLPGGRSFPQSKAEVKERLTAMGGDCAEVLANIEDPQYHQPLAPFDWNYVPSSSGTWLDDLLPNGSPAMSNATSHLAHAKPMLQNVHVHL